MSNISQLLGLAEEDVETSQLLLENQRYRACISERVTNCPKLSIKHLKYLSAKITAALNFGKSKDYWPSPY